MGAGAALYCGTLMLAGIKHGGDATIEVLGKVSLPLRCDTAPATDMPALMPEAAPALTTPPARTHAGPSDQHFSQEVGAYPPPPLPRRSF